MRYVDAARYLYGLAPRGVSLGLLRMERALALRGYPERAQPAVVVAGTNGKGSVASMVASVLAQADLRVGLYTSPHLHRLVERFRINGRAISEREFARRVADLRSFLEADGTPALTFFEVCTLLAFEHFRAAACDIVVLEVGLGGRLDATNVVRPLVSVITGIALDHQDRLGATIGQIAREKAGIVKRSVPLVSAVRDGEAARVIDARARRLGVPRFRIDRELHISPRGKCFDVEIEGTRYEGLPRALSGGYQADNLACAIGAIHVLKRAGFALPVAQIRRGLSRTRWPGRLELFPGAPAVLCDAAHNPHAARALAAHLSELRGQYQRIVLLFGVMADKDHAAMVSALRRHVDAWVFATPATPRAESASVLQARYGGDAVGDPLRAFEKAKKLAGKRGLVVVAGSIFLMAPVRATLAGVRQDPPIAM